MTGKSLQTPALYTRRGPALVFKGDGNMLSFKLDPAVASSYRDTPVNFGFNGLGETLYQRSYSRLKEDGSREQWADTIERVVNGCYTIQKDHITSRNLGWDEVKAQQSAAEMYDRMFHMKFLPPGRGLFAMGSA